MNNFKLINKDCYEFKKNNKTSGLIEIFMRESNYCMDYCVFFMYCKPIDQRFSK